MSAEKYRFILLQGTQGLCSPDVMYWFLTYMISINKISDHEGAIIFIFLFHSANKQTVVKRRRVNMGMRGSLLVHSRSHTPVTYPGLR